MIPVLTPSEMAAVDASADEPVEVLVSRAGSAVARRAVAELGGAYGRRVVVVAGKGNNGADGRDAAARLARRGARVTVFDAGAAPDRLPPADLVVDAAYGTGFRGTYRAPDPGGARVLAVDIPSGVDALTGAELGRVMPAAATVTFAALKPGLLLHPGRRLAGEVTVADIGLDARSGARMFTLDLADARAALPDRPAEAHKWQSATAVVAGSVGMMGAARLCSGGAQRAGAGIVVLTSPGSTEQVGSDEVVNRLVGGEAWATDVLAGLDRISALVIGPGLGRAPTTVADVRRVVAEAPVAAVVDADALWALGSAQEASPLLRARPAPTVLTPHDGEMARLLGERLAPGADRVGVARELARSCRSTVLLKGSTTVVADPEGQVLFSVAGDSRLATAGTGDVLAGVIGAFLARGVPAPTAAASAAVACAEAARRGPVRGLVAGDLLGLLPAVLSGG